MRPPLAAALLGALALASLDAQSSGNINGLILDGQGNPVAAAAVKLFLPFGDAPVRESVTNSAGEFVIVETRPGYYDLLVEASGFSRQGLRNIKVEPGRPVVLAPLTLRPGRFDESTAAGLQAAFDPIPLAGSATGVALPSLVGIGSSVINVHVNSAQIAVQTVGAEIASTVGREQVLGLPVLDRDPMRLIRTQPGVFSGTTSEGTTYTAIHGLRPSYANITLEGVNIQRNYFRADALESDSNRFFLDQISEFTVITANASAQFGGGASQITFVSPSGTNLLHGSAYWLHRSDALKANGFALNQAGSLQQAFSQRQVGGLLQGPIRKNKILYYLNFESFVRKEDTPAVRLIPTSDARQAIAQATGGRLDRVAQQVLDALPRPESINGGRTSAIGQFIFPMRNNLRRQHATAKVDWTASPRHALGILFLWMDENRDLPGRSNNYETLPAYYGHNIRRIAAGFWRWSPTAQITNELRGGMNKAPADFFVREPDLPLVSITPFTSPVNLNFRPQTRTDDTYTLQDNFSVVMAAHTIQAGWQTQLFHTRFRDEAGIRPVYQLSTAFNASFFQVASVTQRFNLAASALEFEPGAAYQGALRFNQSAWYVQDVWKVNRRFTLTLGMRHELPGVPYEANGRTLSPRVIDGDPIRTLLSNATLDFTGGSSGRPWYAADRNNLAPNVGLAWDILGSRRLVFRAAYSVHYVNDDAVRSGEANLERNPGLRQSVARIFATPVTLSEVPPLSPPPLQAPLTFSQALAAGFNPVFAVIDPALRTPYVQQWNAALEHEWRKAVLSVRYIGNHAVKAIVSSNLNQADLNRSGFLDDFRRAERNYALSGSANPSPLCAGCEALRLFPQLPGAFSVPGFTNLLSTGQAGQLAYLYKINGVLDLYPSPFAVPLLIVNNGGASTYHALQLEGSRRFLNGLQMQASYTFSKVLANTGDSAIGSDLMQDRLERYVDSFNQRLARARAPFDMTHALKMNWVYMLPSLGRAGWSRRVFGDWTTSGILTYHTGPPYSVLSSRATYNRTLFSFYNTVNSPLSGDELRERMGFRVDGLGGMAGAGLALGQDVVNPPSGAIGMLSQRMFSGPWLFSLDLAVLKSVSIRERHAVEFRCEARNATNYTNWLVGNQFINSQTTPFGRNTRPLGDSREIQLGAMYRF
jgi:hypothetical protein